MYCFGALLIQKLLYDVTQSTIGGFRVPFWQQILVYINIQTLHTAYFTCPKKGVCGLFRNPGFANDDVTLLFSLQCYTLEACSVEVNFHYP